MMRVKLSKKKGSSLVLVLMVFTVLITVGMAVLSLTAAAYKNRIVEGNVQSNFYLSEAGLDIAYGTIGKVVDDAIQAGNDGVTVLMEGPSAVPNFSQESKVPVPTLNLNQEREIAIAGGTSKYVNSDGTLNESSIQNFQNQIFQEVYENYVQTNIESKVAGADYSVGNANGSHPSIQVTVSPQGSNGTTTVNLLSTFTQNNITKQISAYYDISVPNYQSPYYVTTNVISLPQNPVWQKSLTVGGDLKISNGTVNVTGDIYVQGTGAANSGIDANGNGASLVVTGNVMTNANLQSSAPNTSLDVKGNIYARNVTVKAGADGSAIKSEPESGTQNDGSVYVYSTMSLNAEKSNINILGGFYGVNDNYYSSSGSGDPNQDNSSYIFINSDDLGQVSGSDLSIAKEAYITGTAAIALNNSQVYRTGESIAVKRNYIAYMTPLAQNSLGPSTGDNLGLNNVQFKYLDPLTLVFDKSGNDLSKSDKVDYFDLYLNQYVNGQTNSLFNPGKGISLQGTVHSTGAFVPNAASNPNYNISPSDAAVINEKNQEYEQMVYEMGDINSSPSSGMTAPERSVSTQINFQSITPTIPTSQDVNGQLIVLDGSQNDYAIVAPGSDTSNIPANVKQITLNSANVNENINVNGIIIVNGNLYLCGPINFQGTIITNGSVIIGDNSTKNITYNQNLVSQIIAENYSLFNNVFIHNPAETNSLPLRVEATGTIGKDTSDSNITMDKLIRRRNWTLVK